jgi:hypothetical protein
VLMRACSRTKKSYKHIMLSSQRRKGLQEITLCCAALASVISCLSRAKLTHIQIACCAQIFLCHLPPVIQWQSLRQQGMIILFFNHRKPIQ